MCDEVLVEGCTRNPCVIVFRGAEADGIEVCLMPLSKLTRKLNITESSSVRFLCCMTFWNRMAADTGIPPISLQY